MLDRFWTSGLSISQKVVAIACIRRRNPIKTLLKCNKFPVQLRQVVSRLKQPIPSLSCWIDSEHPVYQYLEYFLQQFVPDDASNPPETPLKCNEFSAKLSRIANRLKHPLTSLSCWIHSGHPVCQYLIGFCNSLIRRNSIETLLFQSNSVK